MTPVDSRAGRAGGGSARRRIVVLGSTGSVGRNALEVATRFPDRLEVIGLAAGRDTGLLTQQARRLGVGRVAVADADRARGSDLAGGEQAILDLATLEDADIVVNAIVGAAGLRASLAALEAGKTLALANKESLVVAGELLTAVAGRHGAEIIPIDSEHNAALQCLAQTDGDEVERLILTASGGPFRTRSRAEIETVGLDEVLNHPTWSMGPRITVDSATLLNKGFEVIEARWLFGLPLARVQVLVHPQSIVHAILELSDGSLLAMMSSPDMRIPIQYALSYPERWPAAWTPLDLARIGNLSFEEPDRDRFPCLDLAMTAAEQGGTAPAVLNAADEALVTALLAGRLRFVELPDILAEIVDEHRPVPATDLDDILAADRWAREAVEHRLPGAAASVRSQPIPLPSELSGGGS